MTTSDSDYFYLPLRDAKKSLNMRINIMAKVSKIRTVIKSRGSDECLDMQESCKMVEMDKMMAQRKRLPYYVLMLKLVDQTESPPGLSVNLFADNIRKLPQVRCTGDVISLHHVELKVNNGEFYCTYNGKLSSYALFDGQSVLDLSPYQTSTNYEAACNYKKLLIQLRTNTEDLQPEHGLVEPSAALFCNLKAEEMLSIVCKVLHASETSDGDMVLFLWDATDSPLVTIQMDLDMEKQEQAPLHPEMSLLPRETLCTFPRLGTIIRCTVTKNFKGASHIESIGYWVKLCNVNFEVQYGVWKSAFTPSTCSRVLTDEDNDVQFRQRIFNGRISSKVDRLPFSVFPWPSHLTETDFAYSSYSTLMESLAYPEVIHRFRTIVRVVAAYPWRAKDLRSPASGKYRVRLTIEDSTARIHAYVYGEDGEKFFDGYPAVDVLSEKMRRLLGIRDGAVNGSGTVPRNPPWVWCCLKSYYLDKSDPWGSRRYRIFGTTLWQNP